MGVKVQHFPLTLLVVLTTLTLPCERDINVGKRQKMRAMDTKPAAEFLVNFTLIVHVQ